MLRWGQTPLWRHWPLEMEPCLGGAWPRGHGDMRLAEGKRKLLLGPLEGLQKVAIVLLLGAVVPPGVVLRRGGKWASAHHVQWMASAILLHSAERLLGVVHEVGRVMLWMWRVRSGRAA